MALAILEWLGNEGASVRFRIDTGTNRYYRFQIGRGVSRRNGLDWVDDVYYTGPMVENRAGDRLFGSAVEVGLPVARFEEGNSYVQLFSFKTEQGRAPGFSSVIPVPSGKGRDPRGRGFPAPKRSAPDRQDLRSAAMSAYFEPVRRIPCRTCEETYSVQASWGDVLGGILKVAGPVLQNLLAGQTNGGQASGGAGGSSSSAAAGSGGQENMLGALLKAVVAALGAPASGSSGGGSPPGATPPAGGADNTSKTKSLFTQEPQVNQFGPGGDAQFAEPFFWQAILQAVAGELVKIAPQLMNSAHEHKLAMKQADNKLVTDALTQVNQRILMEQLVRAQREAQQAGQAQKEADIAKLIEVMQQGGAGLSQASGVVTSQGFWLAPPMSGALSSRAVVSFVLGAPVAWAGMPKALFVAGRPIQIRVQLTVAPPAPKQPLPKAILKIVFKDAAEKVLLEKTFKQKDVAANGVIACAFSAEETAKLPSGQPVTVLAELRWLSPKSAKEVKALGSAEIVLVQRSFLREPEGTRLPGAGPRELVDQQRFRPFWNKIWESPLLDRAAAPRGGEKKYLWELDLNTRYGVLLTGDHDANGLMENKLLAVPADETLTARTAGRMKAGIELSVAEMAKLAALWDGETALDGDRLQALKSADFARAHAGEFIYRARMKGKAAERGMLWVVPAFELFEFTLGAVRRTDDAGQVVEVAEEKVRFPVPVAARVLGLKSGSQDASDEAEADDGAAGVTAPAYRFDGYTVQFSERVALTRQVEMRAAAQRPMGTEGASLAPRRNGVAAGQIAA